jgi:methylated-DNA-[protein]-cysteine S-methyltransferase
MSLVTTIYLSPLGPIRLAATPSGVCEVSLSPSDGPDGAREDDDAPHLVAVARQLAEYFAGVRQVFDVALDVRGTPFQRQIWDILSTIPYAARRTYGDIAKQIGRPTASRAVGSANGANPIAIIVPCHRVIGADGSLTGYASGEHNKRWLLDHEERIAGGQLRLGWR